MRDPLNLLKTSLQEHVTVLARSANNNSEFYNGILVGFDEHWNVCLVDSKDKVVVIRGDIIIYIGQE